MSKYSTKPVVIEAVQLTRELLARCLFDGESYPASEPATYASTYPPARRINDWKGRVTTLMGEIPCAIDDWIIINAKDVYPCRPDVFAATYDVLSPPSMLRELCVALGWQGGTYWQVLAEVKRLANFTPIDTTTPDGEALRNVAPDA